MALTLPTDHFFRDAFREADDVRPSRLSRHRSPRVTLQAARRRFRRHREEGSLSDLPLPSPDTQWFSNFLAPSGVMIPMSGAPHERARSTLRIIPVDVTVRPPRLPRPSSARRCFFEAFFRGRLSTGPRNNPPRLTSRVSSNARERKQETNDAYQLKADIPGVKKEDVTLDVDENIIRIGAKRSETSQKEEESPDKRWHRSERRSYSDFQQRALRMPENTDFSKLRAAFDNGTLTIDVAKFPETEKKLPETKKIAIQ
jgi:HSP20 family protein